VKRLAFLSWARKVGPGENKLNANAIWLGAIWAVCITLLSFTGLGIYAIATKGSIYNFAGLVSMAAFFSVFIGGVLSGNKARFQGWLHGGYVGVIYSLLFFVLAIAMALQSVNLNLISKLFLFVLSGMAGGVLGVNLPANKVLSAKKARLKRSRVNLSSVKRNMF